MAEVYFALNEQEKVLKNAKLVVANSIRQLDIENIQDKELAALQVLTSRLQRKRVYDEDPRPAAEFVNKTCVPRAPIVPGENWNIRACYSGTTQGCGCDRCVEMTNCYRFMQDAARWLQHTELMRAQVFRFNDMALNQWKIHQRERCPNAAKKQRK
ncbi:hypothetical protein [Nereida ignava]|uniref:hypothetical protein n=1 Tax=Nereida ignava TaxID=282199 RepID=UPI0030F84B96